MSMSKDESDLFKQMIDRVKDLTFQMEIYGENHNVWWEEFEGRSVPILQKLHTVEELFETEGIGKILLFLAKLGNLDKQIAAFTNLDELNVALVEAVRHCNLIETKAEKFIELMCKQDIEIFALRERVMRLEGLDIPITTPKGNLHAVDWPREPDLDILTISQRFNKLNVEDDDEDEGEGE